MSYIDNSERTANIYSIKSMHLQVDDKSVFPPSGSNSTQQWILLSSCGAKYTHRDFRPLLVRNLIEEAGKSQDRPTLRLAGRPSVAATNVMRIKRVATTNTGPQNHPQNCAAGHRKSIVYKCARYDVGLCVCGALFCGITHQSKFVNHPLR
jgi:hypothetical protein